MNKLRRLLLYQNPGSFLGNRRERIHFVILIIILLPLSNWLGQNVLLEPAAKWYQDFQLRRRAKSQERWTRIVHIDTTDHENLFAGISPLPGAAVVQAACALVARGSAVVVVDLDTSNSSFPRGFRLPNSATPIVWAVDTDWQDEGGRLVQKADPVLGGRLALQPLYGIATQPNDFDGIVRSWRRFEQVDGYRRPTLPWAAVQAFCQVRQDRCPNGAQGENDTAAFKTDFVFRDIRLSEFLTGTSTELPESCSAQQPDPRLKDRIVVLGGTYSRADAHQTPWGSRAGSELVAMAIESAFDPVPPHKLGEYAEIAIELLIAMLIAAIHHRVRPIPATLFTLGFLPFGALISAEMMFLLRDQAVGIVPFMIGVLIHQLVGSASRAQVLVSEFEKAENRSQQSLGE